jgi:hypothetical protein
MTAGSSGLSPSASRALRSSSSTPVLDVTSYCAVPTGGRYFGGVVSRSLTGIIFSHSHSRLVLSTAAPIPLEH